MVEVFTLAVVGELSAWQTKWETNGQTFFYKYKDIKDIVFSINFKFSNLVGATWSVDIMFLW